MSSRLAKASMWAVAGSGAQGVVTFVLLIYLARVLSPRDFGLMSMVAVGLDLGGYVTRWGQVELLQINLHRNDATRQTSFRLAGAISFLFAAAYLALAEPVARAYHAPEMAWMMVLCAPVFPLMASSIVPDALLRNEMRFRLVAQRNTVTTIVGGLVAVALAWAGFGPIALAMQRVVQAALYSLWNWSSVSWRPRLRAPLAAASTLFHDGASIMVGTILPMLVPRSVDMLVGTFLGPAQLGFMRIAFRTTDFLGQTVIMPLVAVTATQFGSLSGDIKSVARLYLRVTQTTSAMICPLVVGLGMVADLAVPILFGPKWNASVPLIRIVAASALVMPINYYFSNVMIAVGKSRKVIRQGAFQMVAGLIFAGIGSQISIVAVVAANFARGFVTSIYNLIDLKLDLGLPITTILKSLVPAYLATAIMCVAIFAVRAATPEHITPLASLTVATTAGGLAYAAVLFGGEHLGLWSGYEAMIGHLMPARVRDMVSRRRLRTQE